MRKKSLSDRVDLICDAVDRVKQRRADTLDELKIVHAAAVLQGMPRKKPITLTVDLATFRRWQRAIS